MDHSIRTLTGKETFHGTGIIAIISSKLKYDAIKRLKHNSKVDLSATLVKTTPYGESNFNDLLNVNQDQSQDQDLTLQTIHAPEANLDQVKV